MTVTTTTYTTEPLPGNGSTTVFSFSPMVIYASTDIEVYLTNTTTNVATLLEEGTSSTTYSVGLSSYPGTGSITYPASGGSPISSDYTITIVRVLPQTQTVDLTAQGPYNPETLETALDKVVIMIQQLQEQLDRAIVLPPGTAGGFTGNDATPVASGYLRMKNDLSGVEWASLTITDASASDATPTTSSLTSASAGSGTDFSRDDHQHLLPTISVAKGGTGQTTAQAAFEALVNITTVDNTLARFDGTSGSLQESSWALSDGETMTAAGQLSMADNIINRPVIEDYGETVNAIGSIGGGTQDINLTLGNVVSGTVDTSTTTFTFSNPPASGTCGSFTLILTNGGSQTVNWPASVDWAAGAAPTLTTSGVDVLTFFTIDGGTIWYGFSSGLDMS